MGVITTKKSLVQLERLSTAAFCRRRLAVVAVRLKMAETLREACTFIEQARRPAAAAALWCSLPYWVHGGLQGPAKCLGGTIPCSGTMIWCRSAWGAESRTGSEQRLSHMLPCEQVKASKHHLSREVARPVQGRASGLLHGAWLLSRNALSAEFCGNLMFVTAHLRCMPASPRLRPLLQPTLRHVLSVQHGHALQLPCSEP